MFNKLRLKRLNKAIDEYREEYNHLARVIAKKAGIESDIKQAERQNAASGCSHLFSMKEINRWKEYDGPEKAMPKEEMIDFHSNHIKDELKNIMSTKLLIGTYNRLCNELDKTILDIQTSILRIKNRILAIDHYFDFDTVTVDRDTFLKDCNEESKKINSKIYEKSLIQAKEWCPVGVSFNVENNEINVSFSEEFDKIFEPTCLDLDGQKELTRKLLRAFVCDEPTVDREFAYSVYDDICR